MSVFKVQQSLALLMASGTLIVSAAAHAEAIRLASGEVLHVEVLRVTEDAMHFIHPVLGEMTLSREQAVVLDWDDSADTNSAASHVSIAHSNAAELRGPAAPEPAPAPVPQQATGASAAPPPVDEDESPWKFKIVIGAGLATGNSENANFNGMFTAIRELPETKLAFDTGYFYAESDGDRSENRFTAGVRHDWLNPGKKVLYFADMRYDYDEFQSWDSRITGHVGLGYKLIEPPKLKLDVLAGLGAVKEFGSENDDIRPEGLLGIEGKWDISEKQSLTFSSTLFPDLSDFGDFRWVNNAAWEAILDESLNLSLTAGVQHEYQSRVDPGRDRNDLRLFAGLQVDF